MNKTITIHSDNEESRFILTGDISDALKNRRLIFSLKRLFFIRDDEKFFIPYEEKEKIKTLKEIQELLEKFGFLEELTEETQKDIESFQREQETFQEFSEQARKIRNDEFKNNPDLVSGFDHFQKILKGKLVRTLYPLTTSFGVPFSIFTKCL